MGHGNRSKRQAPPPSSVALHGNWRNEYAVPGDESSGPQTFHGSGFTVRAPGVGVIAHIAGLDRPDEPHRGVFRITDDPQVAAALCAALTA